MVLFTLMDNPVPRSRIISDRIYQNLPDLAMKVKLEKYIFFRITKCYVKLHKLHILERLNVSSEDSNGVGP